MDKITIDSGHGGKDNGAEYNFIKEDDINLNISNLLYLMALNKGLDVNRTREIDDNVSLKSRVLQANSFNASAFVSIHCDAFHKKTAHGMSVHIHPKASKNSYLLANFIIDQFKISFPDHKIRGVKESDFYVLRKTNMPAVLIECEFLSNAETREFLKKPENQYLLAFSINKGIGNYFFNKR